MRATTKWLKVCALIGSAGTVLAVAAPATAKDCASLQGEKVASGTVTAATLVAPGKFEPPPSPFPPPPGVTGSPYAGLPEFCRLQVTSKPSSDSDIKIEVWLPAKGWNGKYVGIGNGVWAGQLSISQLVDPLSRGYAVATTDTGHTGNGLSGEFAVGHPEKLIDFGYRAVHEMTVSAKELIAAFYGKAPSFSFWNSCSTGGRQGVMSAYRYPEDYDAISAMAPANPMTDLMSQSMWAGFQPPRTPTSALNPALLTLVHKAVIKECDGLDGLEDGLVSRPDACGFDPGALQCKAGTSEGCLNPEQVATMRAIYDGVRDKNGVRLLTGWPRGAEGQLAALVSGPAPFPVALTYYQLLVHGGDKNWDWKTMDYGVEVPAARAFAGSILDVPPDGLAPFFARGGKLLLSHGWTDGLIPANNAVNFYTRLYPTIPLAQAQQQLRLFMVPGMDHCGGGEGPGQFDTLAVIDNWATTGKAPNRIVATRGGGGPPGAPQLPPLSRPLCPYPLYPAYDGVGPKDEAESFTCALPPG